MIKDLTGMKFGRLTVIGRAANFERSDGGIRIKWLCKCECGNECEALGENLVRGATQSCGCLRTERFKNRNKSENEYFFNDDCGVCLTPDGYTFMFDKEDFERIKPYRWTATADGYIRTTIKGKTTTLQRFIAGCPTGLVVDHINNNILDNRRKNLQSVTYEENERAKHARNRSDEMQIRIEF